MLAQIGAHSDDEEVPGKGFYMIKTLPYRSNNANKFFRRLDDLMKTAAESDPLAKRSRRRVRRPPKTPVPSVYTAAPKGLPIDFYHPRWYHKLPDSHKRSIPDRTSLAFLPDAKQSLIPKPNKHPDEYLKDSTFTRKYWEVLAEPYGLAGGDSSESEEASQEEENSDEEGIDLTQPSPDASDDEFYKEGDAGDLYDQEDDFVASDDEEEGSNEEEEGGASDDEDDGDDQDGEEEWDGDCMMEIPEGEENWE